MCCHFVIIIIIIIRCLIRRHNVEFTGCPSLSILTLYYITACFVIFSYTKCPTFDVISSNRILLHVFFVTLCKRLTYCQPIKQKSKRFSSVDACRVTSKRDIQHNLFVVRLYGCLPHTSIINIITLISCSAWCVTRRKTERLLTVNDAVV